jgi:hypothetical protein
MRLNVAQNLRWVTPPPEQTDFDPQGAFKANCVSMLSLDPIEQIKKK